MGAMNDLSQGQHQELTAEQQWEKFSKLKTSETINIFEVGISTSSLGERIEEPVDHPIIRPSINMAESHILAEEDPDLATAWSSISSNRSIASSTYPSLKTLFKEQNATPNGSAYGHLFSTLRGTGHTECSFLDHYDIDKKHGTPYHERYVNF